MATETVTSILLSDPPPVPAETPVRPVDEDYAATVAAGYVEDDETFGIRIGGPR